jgi:1,6-anhydro-N-acetylmuramate kinase
MRNLKVQRSQVFEERKHNSFMAIIAYKQLVEEVKKQPERLEAQAVRQLSREHIEFVKQVKHIGFMVRVAHIPQANEPLAFQLLNIQLFLRLFQLEYILCKCRDKLEGRIQFGIPQHNNL